MEVILQKFGEMDSVKINCKYCGNVFEFMFADTDKMKMDIITTCAKDTHIEKCDGAKKEELKTLSMGMIYEESPVSLIDEGILRKIYEFRKNDK